MSYEWEFYSTRVEDLPASTYVCLAYGNAAPIPEQSDLTLLRLYLLQPRDDGLSSREEFDRLCEIEDSLENALKDSPCVNYYVGRTTYAGSRVFYYYSANHHQIEKVISQTMVAFAEYEFELEHRSEPNWNSYLNFLFPTPWDFQCIQNRHVLQSLEESNDLMHVPRRVLHWAYFVSCDDRDQFLTAVQSEGFRLETLIEPDTNNPKYGVIVFRMDTVDHDTINEVTLLLFDLASDANGTYDGWETPVLKESE